MNKNLPLESLRGIAALLVVLFHFKFNTPLVDNPLIHHAYVMVDLFFVLSGYVIAMNYLHRLDSWEQVRQFQIRRFWRLYPLHLATLGFFVLRDARFAVSALLAGKTTAPILEGAYLYKLMHNLLLTHALFLEKLSFVWPSWSISTEFYTYILFALVVWRVRRGGPIVWLLIAGGAGYINWRYGTGLRSSCGFGIFRCMYSFFLGALTWRAVERVKLPRQSGVALAVLLLSGVATVWLPGGRAEPLLPVLFCGLVAAVAALDERAWLRRVLSIRLLVYLGTISYSVYLTHAIVIVLFLAVLGRLGIPVAVAPEGHNVYMTSALQGTGLVLLGVALTLGVSHLTYRFIEDRFRHGLRRRAA